MTEKNIQKAFKNALTRREFAKRIASASVGLTVGATFLKYGVGVALAYEEYAA